VDPYSALVDPQGLFSLLPENNQPDWVVNVVSLIDQAQTTGDREELASTVMDIERILHDQAAFNCTFQYRDVYGINSALSWEPRTDELVDLAGAELE
jgi:hypothetical protein